MTFIKFEQRVHPNFPDVPLPAERIDLGEKHPDWDTKRLYEECDQVTMNMAQVKGDPEKAKLAISLLFGEPVDNLSVKTWGPKGQDPMLFNIAKSRLPVGLKDVELTDEQKRQLGL